MILIISIQDFVFYWNIPIENKINALNFNYNILKLNSILFYLPLVKIKSTG